jgi:uncharacterized membrane protein
MIPMSFKQRYRWLLPALVFTVTLLAARAVVTGSVEFGFLLWNLFLALIPLGAAHKLRSAKGKPALYGWAFIWLLFFPNAPYIITDLVHLRERPDIPFWVDLLLLLSAAVNGAVWGFLSLLDVEAWLLTRIQRRWVHRVIFIIMLACGFGVYLGRFLRYNSWDILTDPRDLGQDIASHIIHPFRHAEAWALTCVFGIWCLFLYQGIKQLRSRLPTQLRNQN